MKFVFVFCLFSRKKRILKINILVDGSKAKTSPSITCLKQVVHETVLPIEKHSLTPAIFWIPFICFCSGVINYLNTLIHTRIQFYYQFLSDVKIDSLLLWTNYGLRTVSPSVKCIFSIQYLYIQKKNCKMLVTSTMYISLSMRCVRMWWARDFQCLRSFQTIANHSNANYYVWFMMQSYSNIKIISKVF